MHDTIPVPEARSWLHRLFLLRQLGEQRLDAEFSGFPPPPDCKVVLYNETDAGLGDAAFMHKMLRVLTRELPGVSWLVVAVEPSKHAVFGTEALAPVVDVAEFGAARWANWRRPDLVISAPGIFDHCRTAEVVLPALGIEADVPFLYLAEYGSLRQLRDDAFKALLPAIDGAVDAALDEAAKAAGVGDDEVGHRGASGEILARVDGAMQPAGSLLTALARDGSPLWPWLSAGWSGARSCGLELGELGVFTGDGGQTSGTSSEKTPARYIAYAHGAHGQFLCFVAALESQQERSITVITPSRRTAEQALEDFLQAPIDEALAAEGVGTVVLTGNREQSADGRSETVTRKLRHGGKTLRIDTRHPVPYDEYLALQRGAEPATMVTGDQSFSDAVAMGRAILLIEPMYCQTWVLDAQIALAEQVSEELAMVLRFGTAAKWDAGFWPEVAAILRRGDVVQDALRFAETVRREHRVEGKLPQVVCRALWTARERAIEDAVAEDWARAWRGFVVDVGLELGVTGLGEALARVRPG